MQIPLIDQWDKAERILIAGAGGGFDVYSGLPLYFALTNAGKKVFLASFSFSMLTAVENSDQFDEFCWKVTEDSHLKGNYFPEGCLARWLAKHNYRQTIYTIMRTGPAYLRSTYQKLVDQESIDTVILVDGGTDSLMCGNEAGLGTPSEDITSLVAVSSLKNIEQSFLVCLGFGIDHYHGVCHAQFLEAVSDIARMGGYLGSFSLLPVMEEVSLYMEVVRYANKIMPEHQSIVCNSIVSALEGYFGDYHATPRTAGSTLWINPLMTFYWCFYLPTVMKRLLYPDSIYQAESLVELLQIIKEFRRENLPKKWQSIPL